MAADSIDDRRNLSFINRELCVEDHSLNCLEKCLDEKIVPGDIRLHDKIEIPPT